MGEKSNPFFRGIRDAMVEGLEALREGRPLTTRDVVLPDPPRQMSAEEIARLRRDKLGVSQAVFANLMNTAVQTIHAWEQGRNRPSGSALRLLRLVDARPETFRDMLESTDARMPIKKAKSRSA
jgi:putative transcriptional regulator